MKKNLLFREFVGVFIITTSFLISCDGDDSFEEGLISSEIVNEEEVGNVEEKEERSIISEFIGQWQLKSVITNLGCEIEGSDFLVQFKDDNTYELKIPIASEVGVGIVTSGSGASGTIDVIQNCSVNIKKGIFISNEENNTVSLLRKSDFKFTVEESNELRLELKSSDKTVIYMFVKVE